MARNVMASFPLTVLLAFSLSFAFVLTFSDAELKKLDDIERLLQRLDGELKRMKDADNARHITKEPSVKNATDDNVTDSNNNDNKTETSFETNDNRTDEDYDIRNLTTRLENTATQNMEGDSHTTISDSTGEVLNSATPNSGLKSSSSRGGPEVTTVPSPTTHQGSFQTTGVLRSWFTQTSRMHETTADETKDKDNKDKDNKDNEGKDNEVKDEEKDKEEENELREVQNVRRLIDEGEDLERQLKDVFSQLRSLSRCRHVDEKCGVKEGVSRCCKGLKCSGTWSGICNPDCVPFRQSCAENFFCCSGYQCKKSIDSKGQKINVCQ